MRATVITLVEGISKFPNSLSEEQSSVIQIYGGKKQPTRQIEMGK